MPNWMGYKFFFHAVKLKPENTNYIFYRYKLLPIVCIKEIIKEMSHKTGMPKPGEQSLCNEDSDNSAETKSKISENAFQVPKLGYSDCP